MQTQAQTQANASSGDHSQNESPPLPSSARSACRSKKGLLTLLCSRVCLVWWLVK